VVGSCEYNNEPSGYTKGRELLDQLCDHKFLKRTAPMSWLDKTTHFSGIKNDDVIETQSSYGRQNKCRWARTSRTRRQNVSKDNHAQGRSDTSKRNKCRTKALKENSVLKCLQFMFFPHKT